MFHLTLTGFYAGTPICGVNKVEAIKNGDKFVHAVYYGIHSQQGCAPVCAECLKIWKEAETDTD